MAPGAARQQICRQAQTSDNRRRVLMFVALTCPCCGGGVDRSKLECEYCGSKMVYAADGTTAIGSAPAKCPGCGATVFDGTQFCLTCSTILIPSERLTRKAQKVRFAQDKYRASFIPEVSKALLTDEFVLADTYGPEEWFILTTKRLLICRLVIKSGLFSNSVTLQGIKGVVTLENVTSHTSFSNPWYASGVGGFGPALLSMQISTFEGEFNLNVYMGMGDPPVSKDPWFFLRTFIETYALVEAGKKHPDDVLYNLKQEPPPLPPPVPKPHEEPVAESPLIDDADMKFQCPNCGQHLEAERDMAGTVVDCPSCQQKIQLPST